MLTAADCDGGHNKSGLSLRGDVGFRMTCMWSILSSPIWDFLAKVHDVEPIAWLVTDWAERFSEKENMTHAAIAGNILNV
jgi:hypothetical protein